MIQWLKIKNLALVEDAEIEFDNGFNVISGETGAGKSVIINAISLLLGKRTDKSLIRSGKTKCELSAGIIISTDTKKKLSRFFDDNGIEELDREIILRKVITQSSSRNFINDSSVTLNALGILASELIDFHGPNQHYSLQKPSLQLEILDKFGALHKLRNNCATAFSQLLNAQEELAALNHSLPDAVEAEHLRKIVREIEATSDYLDEENNLSEQFKRASSSKDILQLVYETNHIIRDAEDSIIDKLASSNRVLSGLSRFDETKAEEFLERFSNISDDINELSIDLENYSSNIEIDELEYFELEEKINSINSLKRKFGSTIEEILSTMDKAKEKLATVDNFEHIREELESKVKDCEQEYQKIANHLSKERVKISKHFSKLSKEALIKLGFLKAEISVAFQTTPPSSTGIDKIEILFSANPGEENLPLRSVASSGEISRVMLAIKTVLSDTDEIPILIFDEIDANIGGEVAHQVGEELHNLANKHHVLCISHLPQVASFADSHFKVEKEVINSRTFSKIKKLSNKEQIKEIGRMLGGGIAAEKHAEDLLKKHKTKKYDPHV